ncbi:MAG: SDR family oxidoreductase [Acidimicrobiales bacterium]|nr:SDR family oxidoreductase [Acidimicrobiales bacterium]
MNTDGTHVAGKVIVITGAGGGFGRLVAQMGAKLGARIVAADVNAEGLDETVASITDEGGTAVGVTADVTSKADCDRVAAAAVEQFGSIDVLVNNAGIMPLAFFADHEQAWEAWDRAIDINFKGVVHGIASVYDQMVEQGRGHIINISSIYGNHGVAGSGVYSATKAAVGVLSDALRVESQGKIKVTTVRPTGVPATGLGLTVVNYEATVGITGQNTERFGQKLGDWLGGNLGEGADPDDVRYWTLDPTELAEQIIAVIDTPWGVTISDITVRATGEDYVL